MTEPPKEPPAARPHSLDLTIQEFGRRLRSGETTCERVTHQFLELAATEGKRLNAFILVMTSASAVGETTFGATPPEINPIV